MSNASNLIPQSHILTKEENAAGGRASGIARRRKSICNKLLNGEITNEEAKKELINKGLQDDELTELAISMYDLLRTSRDRKKEKTRDRLLALKMFMEYAESDKISSSNETPSIEVNIVDNSDLESVLYESNN